MDIIIKPMETDDEIRGKAYVHWKSWQESYAGIIDADYLSKLTLDGCEEKAFRWRDNLLVAKDGTRVVGFVGYGVYLGFIFDGGEYFMFFYAFILPVLMLFRFTKALFGERAGA